jgi:hypothetical protein
MVLTAVHNVIASDKLIYEENKRKTVATIYFEVLNRIEWKHKHQRGTASIPSEHGRYASNVVVHSTASNRSTV